ncbi:MAG: sensor histidine kinase [Bacteroides sp.]
MLTRPLNILLLLLATSIIVFSLFISRRHAKQLEQEEKDKITLWAEATRRAVNLNSPPQDYEFILQVIEKNESVPVILTDAANHVISARNLASTLLADSMLLKELLADFSNLHPPIHIQLPNQEEHFIYYGRSSILNELRYYPYIQLALIITLVFLTYLVFVHARRAEQNSVWIGMARETAHQLGTPISSLVAWQEILTAEDTDLIDSHILAESIGLDILRLKRVAERFSKMGAKPQLDDESLVDTLYASVQYMHSRISQKIKLTAEIRNTPIPIAHNAILIQWVIENLLRNAVDAIAHGGTIHLSLSFENKHAIIDCIDSGAGISKRKWKTIFKPGYSTKTRGWGLGLSLAKRIIKEFHHGKIFVLSSSPHGTTFRIILPT